MFSKIEAKNFLSWEALDFTFETGVMLIEGYNHDDGRSEGSGKSSILNALCWGLFGRIPKDANTDEVVREGCKSCEVRVVLDSGMAIVRTRGPNKLYMYDSVNDTECVNPVKGKDAKETQRLIEDIIGMSFETFCQSVYFSQNYTKKFITATEEEKAKILSELQDLGQFDKARKVAADRAKGVEADVSALSQEIRISDQKISTNLEAARQVLKLKDAQVAEQAKRIQEIAAEIEFTESVLKNMKLEPVTVEDTTALEAELKELTAKEHVLRNKIAFGEQQNTHATALKARLTAEEKRLKLQAATVARKQETYLAPAKPVCPTCSTQLENDICLQDYFATLKAECVDIEQGLTHVATELAGFTLIDVVPYAKELEVVKSQATTLAASLSQAKGAEKRYIVEVEKKKSLETTLATSKKRLITEQIKSFDTFDEQLNAIKKRLDTDIAHRTECYAILETKTVELTQLETLKEGFKELKSHVFRSVLNELSFKANKYLSVLFKMPVQIIFDNASEEGEINKIFTHVTMDGATRPLGLYSGGQFRRIQLAVDLALSDIIAGRSGKPITLRIFDEVLKDLSLESKEEMLRLIEGLKGCVILIEHDEMFRAIVSKTYRVELKDGISRKAA